MCEDCFDKEFKRFESQNEFEKFVEKLDLKCRSNQMVILKSDNENDSDDYPSSLFLHLLQDEQQDVRKEIYTTWE